MWRPVTADLFLFVNTQSRDGPLFIAHSDDCFKPYFDIFPCGKSDRWAQGWTQSPASSTPVSVGFGVRGGRGPRPGNSSGLRPGNSSGRGASPGSRIGGGTSGRGLPGGLSCGGSEGCPGLIGGSSCGSIGMFPFPEFLPESEPAPTERHR